MTRVLGWVLRFPQQTWAAAVGHPLWTALVALVVAAGAGIGVWQYALYQWRAAELAVKEDRPAEAQDRLKFCLRVWPRSPDVHLLAARAARLAGDLSDAETHLNRCIELQGVAT
jgi:predicted Zn-dependent protease